MGKRRRPGQGKKSSPRPQVEEVAKELATPPVEPEPIYARPSRTIQFDQDPLVLWSVLIDNGAWEASVRSDILTPLEGEFSVHNTQTGTRILHRLEPLTEAEVYSCEYSPERQREWQEAAARAIDTRKTHDTERADPDPGADHLAGGAERADPAGQLVG